ncbi:MAG: hypothetical protein IJJ33_08360, partial [Victivallales bacterium]|nr:hypothetical protein [Victivallales bacterium]
TDISDIRNNYMAEDREQFRPLDNLIFFLHQMALTDWSEMRQVGTMQAAAGDALRSEVYIFHGKGENIVPLGTAEADDFEPVSKGGKLPKFVWTIQSDDVLQYDGANLIFRLKSADTIIGTGAANANGNQLELVLSEPIIEGVPDIKNVNDIQVIIV